MSDMEEALVLLGVTPGELGKPQTNIDTSDSHKGACASTPASHIPYPPHHIPPSSTRPRPSFSTTSLVFVHRHTCLARTSHKPR